LLGCPARTAKNPKKLWLQIGRPETKNSPPHYEVNFSTDQVEKRWEKNGSKVWDTRHATGKGSFRELNAEPKGLPGVLGKLIQVEIAPPSPHLIAAQESLEAQHGDQYQESSDHQTHPEGVCGSNSKGVHGPAPFGRQGVQSYPCPVGEKQRPCPVNLLSLSKRREIKFINIGQLR
jgi:hypothetical protein